MSDDKKEVNVEAVSVEEAVTEQVAPKVDAMEAKYAELNDKYLRLAAELENTRRRAALDAESRARNRAMSVAEKILPVMDAVDAALKLAPNDEGIQTMARALESAFEQIGITRIKSVGEALNPMHHNAIQVVECPDKKSNIIIDEMQPGYLFGDTILRTAMVVVAK